MFMVLMEVVLMLLGGGGDVEDVEICDVDGVAVDGGGVDGTGGTFLVLFVLWLSLGTVLFTVLCY